MTSLPGRIGARWTFAVFLSLGLLGPTEVDAAQPSGFKVKRGTNISHWLSQSPRRGAERRAWFTREDVAWLAALGFDHVRLPIDEEQMWDANGKPDP